MTRLASPLDQMAPTYDAVVIGSGYGGGVAASRLSRMGYKVALLERGGEIRPGEYPDTPEKALAQSQVHAADITIGHQRGLFDLHVGKEMNVLVGCGLGGTSLINANVSIEADPRVFEDPAWPPGLADADLKEGYSRARAMLQPSPYPDGAKGWPALNKLEAMKRSARELGAELKTTDINVTFADGHNAAGVWQKACNLCGDCCSGCNVGAKNTTLMNYLPDAAANGARIFCGAQARWIEADGKGGWRVRLQPTGFARETFDAEPLSVEAAIVVIAAGTLGSTEILLRSREHGLSLSNALGTRFSGNGDVLAFGYNCDVPIDGIGMGYKAAAYDRQSAPERPVGPTITGLIDLRSGPDLEAGMIIEEGSIPGGLGSFLPEVMALAARAHGTDTDEGDILSEEARVAESITGGPYRGAVNHSQTFLVMSHDGADGRLVLKDDRINVDWPGVGEKPGFERVAKNIEQCVAALGGTYVPNPIWTDLFAHELVTVHPLGGCPMGTSAAVGVVDEACRLFKGKSGKAVHDGLYVCDGSVMPRSLGVNPLLTIAGVSERAMIRLARDKGRKIGLEPAPRQPAEPPTAAARIGIRFTEKMAGSVRSLADGKDYPADFVLTVVAGDLEELLEVKEHEAKLVGTISLPPLSKEPLTVHSGSWNLFIEDEDRPDTKRMAYRMPIEAGGKAYLATGEKLIHDDPGFDLWKDTTTLDLVVRQGADGSGKEACRGTLVIRPLDFITQMRTMTVTGAPDFGSRMRAMGAFGRFFGGRLFESFGGPFAAPSLFDPDAARVRRPLRAGVPEVHHFTTSDGKVLRFTRYEGGTKGPVIFSHGLGVSSLIFSIDTIDPNLLETLYAAGYDCWLLDYRASIELPYTAEQFTADDIAEKDYPAAVELVREMTGAPSVQMVAHCYGAMTFAMAMLSGLNSVRSAVISQIAAHADVPFWPQRLLAFLHAPALMSLVGAKTLDARATIKRNAISRAIDAILSVYPYRPQDRTRSATSRRITALYGPLYELSQLNAATLAALPEMFGKANIAAFRQLSKIARAGEVVPASGGKAYVTESNLRNFAIPTLFVHGELNGAFSPSGTRKTIAALERANGPGLYERFVVPGTGHIDCIFGKNAARDVFPRILAHLEKSARA